MQTSARNCTSEKKKSPPVHSQFLRQFRVSQHVDNDSIADSGSSFLRKRGQSFNVEEPDNEVLFRHNSMPKSRQGVSSAALIMPDEGVRLRRFPSPAPNTLQGHFNKAMQPVQNAFMHYRRASMDDQLHPMPPLPTASGLALVLPQG